MSRFVIVAPLAAAMFAAAPAAAVTPLIGAGPHAAQFADAALAPAAQKASVAPSLADMRPPADSHASLPEPATWFTLIVGFALVGFAARWRRPSAVA